MPKSVSSPRRASQPRRGRRRRKPAGTRGPPGGNPRRDRATSPLEDAARLSCAAPGVQARGRDADLQHAAWDTSGTGFVGNSELFGARWQCDRHRRSAVSPRWWCPRRRRRARRRFGRRHRRVAPARSRAATSRRGRAVPVPFDGRPLRATQGRRLVVVRASAASARRDCSGDPSDSAPPPAGAYAGWWTRADAAAALAVAAERDGDDARRPPRGCVARAEPARRAVAGGRRAQRHLRRRGRGPRRASPAGDRARGAGRRAAPGGVRRARQVAARSRGASPPKPCSRRASAIECARRRCRRRSISRRRRRVRGGERSGSIDRDANLTNGRRRGRQRRRRDQTRPRRVGRRRRRGESASVARATDALSRAPGRQRVRAARGEGVRIGRGHARQGRGGVARGRARGVRSARGAPRGVRGGDGAAGGETKGRSRVRARRPGGDGGEPGEEPREAFRRKRRRRRRECFGVVRERRERHARFFGSPRNPWRRRARARRAKPRERFRARQLGRVGLAAPVRNDDAYATLATLATLATGTLLPWSRSWTPAVATLLGARLTQLEEAAAAAIDRRLRGRQSRRARARGVRTDIRGASDALAAAAEAAVETPTGTTTKTGTRSDWAPKCDRPESSVGRRIEAGALPFGLRLPAFVLARRRACVRGGGGVRVRAHRRRGGAERGLRAGGLLGSRLPPINAAVGLPSRRRSSATRGSCRSHRTKPDRTFYEKKRKRVGGSTSVAGGVRRGDGILRRRRTSGPRVPFASRGDGAGST